MLLPAHDSSPEQGPAARSLTPWQRRLLRGRFLLASMMLGAGVAAALDDNDTTSISGLPVETHADRDMALYSGLEDPVLRKPLYGAFENEYNVFARHQVMMRDPENQKQFKAWLAKLDPVMDAEPVAKLDALRRLVQSTLDYTHDETLYNVDEYIAPPLQTLRAGYGDCDDYSIVYYYGARYLGFTDAQCYSAIVGTKGGWTNHRVTLVDIAPPGAARLQSDNIYILDNGGPLKHLEQTDFIVYNLINRQGSHVVQDGIDDSRRRIGEWLDEKAADLRKSVGAFGGPGVAKTGGAVP